MSYFPSNRRKTYGYYISMDSFKSSELEVNNIYIVRPNSYKYDLS